MSVNLTKHQNTLLEAWKDVTDDKSATNWALFGYEKQTNDLYVVDKGDGGLEELADELNSGKIMYAFVRVIDPNTELPKFVFINWQGEGAPFNRKGACANHVHEVAKFFKGAHVTINARMEDDVEPAVVLEKVAKASASQFNFKDRSEPLDGSKCAPVGSVYKRIMPTREINPAEREKFWIKEQEEEKKRIYDEKKKAEVEKKRLEEERNEREIRDSSAREQWVKERSRSINQMREAEKNADNTAKSVAKEKVLWEKQLLDDAADDKERRTRSETLRRERSYEAQNLISQRNINARAIFEQNTCAGQLNSIKTPRQPHILQEFEENQARLESKSISPPASYTSPVAEQPPVSYTSPVAERPPVSYVSPVAEQPPVSYTSPVAEQPPTSYVSPVAVQPPVSYVSPVAEQPPEKIQEAPKAQKTEMTSLPEEFSYTRNLLKEGLSTRQDSEMETNVEEEQNWDEPTLEAPPNVKDPLTEMMAEHGMVEQSVDDTQIITSDPYSDQGLRARALYDYQAADDTEISFDPDDIITHIEQIDEGWWQGLAPDGSYGLFPANYVELLDTY